MIKEIVNFTDSIDTTIKNYNLKLREGLHIKIGFKVEDSTVRPDLESVYYERFTNKLERSDFLENCAFLSANSWCIDTNKCFDLPSKGIHSCSPYCVAFKKENLEGGAKYLKNLPKNKPQIYERFSDYFAKALLLVEDNPEEFEKCKIFKSVFTQPDAPFYFNHILASIENEMAEKSQELQNEIDTIKNAARDITAKSEKTKLKEQLDQLGKQLEPYKPLSDSDYIIFYLEESIDTYKAAHLQYLSERLFNTGDYTLERASDVVGTSNFFNGFNSNMPFLLHNTASFDISGRISAKEARTLEEFKNLLPRAILPKPLPIFIYKEELQNRVLDIFKEEGFKAGYKEIIEKIFKEQDSPDFSNYYLMFYQNTKDGLVFNDIDFVPKFEYELKDHSGKKWEVKGLFYDKYAFEISNIFHFQNEVLRTIFNNQLISKDKNGIFKYKYFDEIQAKYCKSAANHLLIMTYRKAFYDFVYKSRRSAVGSTAFHDIMYNSILEDIRLDEYKNNKHKEHFNILKKLNIWFSLYEKFDFNPQTTETMASKLKNYQQFMTDLVNDEADLENASVEDFAFATGQVIYYILKKSKSADQSYQRLERYLQQANFEGVKQVITTEFARYKHENFSRRFERAASFVLTYETKESVKKYMPQILGGIFSNNHLYGNKAEKEVLETPEQDAKQGLFN
ncbi:MAG: hypothetical protein JJT94_02905 [Bernardetiaceae bacterium]|nr:hypothetical protein [Bernardetiaceae bacterium]